MPSGGHGTCAAALMSGELALKKAQKKAKKNITSEAMNSRKPTRRPWLTGSVW